MKPYKGIASLLSIIVRKCVAPRLSLRNRNFQGRVVQHLDHLKKSANHMRIHRLIQRTIAQSQTHSCVVRPSETATSIRDLFAINVSYAVPLQTCQHRLMPNYGLVIGKNDPCRNLRIPVHIPNMRSLVSKMQCFLDYVGILEIRRQPSRDSSRYLDSAKTQITRHE
jgi:hypothetical protein